MKFKNLTEKVHIHETLRIGVLLAFVGGFLDVYTYMLWGGVFANAQTGNIVLMAVHLAKGNFRTTIVYIVPIVAYFIGVVLTELIKNSFKDRDLLKWQHIVISIEIILLFIIGFFPASFEPMIVTTAISFICSMQTNCFRRTRGLPYATTMCTGNLRSAGEHFYKAMSTRSMVELEKFLRYTGVLLAFCLGAGLAVLFVGILGVHSIWICCGVLFAILMFMLFERK